MTSRPPSSGRALWILIRMAGWRWINRLGNVWSRRKRSGPGPKRRATRGKRLGGRVLAVFVAISFTIMVVQYTVGLLSRMTASIDQRQREVDGRPPRIEVSHWVMNQLTTAEAEGQREAIDRYLDKPLSETWQAPPGSPDATGNDWKPGPPGRLTIPLYDEANRRELHGREARTQVRQWLRTFADEGADAFTEPGRPSFAWRGPLWPTGSDGKAAAVRVIALLVLLVALVVLTGEFGGQGKALERIQPTLQWLFTQPVRSPVILLTQLLRDSLFSAGTWIAILPLMATILVCAGLGLATVLLAPLAALTLSVVVQSVSLPLAIWLRRRLSADRVQVAQGVSTVLGLAFMAALFLFVLGDFPEWLVPTLALLPEWLFWLPVMVMAQLAIGGPTTLVAATVLAALLVVAPAVSVHLAGRLLRRGLLAEAGPARRKPRRSTPWSAGHWRGIIGRELRLLTRRHWLLAQILAAPVFMLVIQFLIHRASWTDKLADPRHGAVMAYGLAAYMLWIPGMRALLLEGEALWILYASPLRLERAMALKARVWAAIALFYGAVILAVSWLLNPEPSAARITAGLFALAGIPMIAYAVTGLGVLGTNPLEQDPKRQVRPGCVYGVMVLSAMYAWAIYSPSWYQSLAVAVQVMLITYAIWQQVRDAAPYLLDPVLKPPPRLRLSDGLITALAFFVIQGIFVFAIATHEKKMSALALVTGYSVAGGIVLLGAPLVLAIRRIPDLRRTIGLVLRPPPGRRSSWLIAAGLGLAVGVVGVLYTWLVLSHFESGELDLWRDGGPGSRIALAILFILVAPVVEEPIFRGLLYGGMRRTWSRWRSLIVVSALFALIHPAVSAPVVFPLGLAATWVYDRSGRLLEPITTHMIYNACIVVGLLMLHT